MRRVSMTMSLLFVAAGVLLVFGGYALKLKGHYGPGPGFTAFWVGVPLTALSLVWFVRLWRQRENRDELFVAARGGLARVAAVVVALCAFAALLNPLGFNASMLLLLLFLLFAFNRDYAVLKLLIAFAGSFGVHYAFEHYLRVALPYASIETLRAFGL